MPPSLTIVISRKPLKVGVATLVARMRRLAGLGTVAGAVYAPVCALMLPFAGVGSSMLHVTR